MSEPLEPLNFFGSVFNIKDGAKFQQALALLSESLFDGGRTLYVADNIITWNRNLSFMRDPFFLDMMKNEEASLTDRSLAWRRYILHYFADFCRGLDGDFMEVGCYEGTSAEVLIKRLDFGKLDKAYYIYDLFEWAEGDGHTHLPAHDTGVMYETVMKRFAPYPFVKLIKGFVPDSFDQGFPDKIAFAHIDMNNHIPEAAALERILPRLAQGGAIVFDDYGWWGYSRQKAALDPIAERHGQSILELPTGQAVLLKK